MSKPKRKPKAAASAEATAAAPPAPRAAEARPATEDPPAASTPLTTKHSVSAGIVAAMILAVLVNVLVARHYRRWDWTQGGLYTLSDATLQTLRSLEEPVQVYVLLSPGDPLEVSLEHLLAAYRAETTRLDVRYTDPDRHPAEFLAVQQRFGIVPGKTDDGRIVTDASVVVVRGDKPHFITPRDLVEVDDADDLRARPRLEQALTGAIRSVVGGERPKVCFTTGHGEPSLEGALGPLRARLGKNNYDVEEIAPTRAAPGERDKLATCRLVVLAGPSQKVPAEDVARLRAYLVGGGNALLVVGQEPEGEDERYLDLGTDELLAAAGVKLESDFVFELDPARRASGGLGETFLPAPRPHAITDGLLKAAERDQGLDVVMTVASSLTPTGGGTAAPVPLLVTSDASFGMVDFFAWAKHPSAPSPGEADHKGPLTVAYAAELPKTRAAAPHGPRVGVVGSSSGLQAADWRDEGLRGAMIFVESAIAWLAAQPVALDIPSKPAFTAGLHMTEDRLTWIFRYVVLFVPLASLLLGISVMLRRTSTERRGAREGARRGGEAHPTPAKGGGRSGGPDEKGSAREPGRRGRDGGKRR